MIPKTLELDFDPVTFEAWRARVDADPRTKAYEALVHQTLEGFARAPLYGPDGPDAPPPPAMTSEIRAALDPARARAGWEACTRVAHADLDAARAAVADDLDGDADGLWLVVDPAAALGGEPTPSAGLAIRGADDLADLLDGVALDGRAIHLDAGPASLEAAPHLLALWSAAGTGPEAAAGTLGLDPLGALARHGVLPTSVDDALGRAARLAADARAEAPRVRAFTVDATCWHEAGADMAQELGLAAAAAAAYLRAMDAAGIPVAEAAPRLGVRVALGTDFLAEIAKLRALRLVIARIFSAAGVTAAPRVHVHAVGGDRALGRYERWTNALRSTATCFAAAIGGADAITVPPVDRVHGTHEALARRVARNTHHVLARESHLARVIDPAGGSWAIEHLTAQLAARAWAVLQRIEGEGGAAEAIAAGTPHRLIAEAADARASDLARGRRQLTGVTAFPDPSEPPPAGSDAPAPTPLAARLTGGADALGADAARATPLPTRRLAAPFEALRAAADGWLERQGARPRIALICLGPLAEHDARTAWAANFFGVAGFESARCEAVEGPADARAALASSEAAIACISAADPRYPDAIPWLIPALRDAGARGIWVAGRPPAEHAEAWAAAGVTGFVHRGCDLLAALTLAQRAAEVSS